MKVCEIQAEASPGGETTYIFRRDPHNDEN